MTDLKKINAITQALQAAEMRQGCTNHSHYAWELAKELGLTVVSPPAPAAEPKKGKELHCAECGQYLPTALTHHDYEQCQAYKAQFQPQVEALTRQVKEVEEEKANLQFAYDTWFAIAETRYAKIASLESQLKQKPVSGWEETVLSEAQQEVAVRKDARAMWGLVKDFPITLATLLKAQAELTWRKALEQEKGK